MTGNADPRVYLVLDSTEVTGDWLLEGAAFREVAKIRGLRVAIPAPVSAELQGNHERTVADIEAATHRLLRDRRRLGLTTPDFEPSTVPYGELLNDALSRRQIEILPWPKTSHEDVVTRAVARQAPFDQKGGGYRDTLVWLTVKELVADGCHVYLASRDRAFQNDRAGGDGLAKSLLSEAATLEGTVELVTNLRDWVLERAAQSPRPTDAALMQVRTDRFVQEFLGPWSFETAQIYPGEAGLPLESEILGDVEILDTGDLKVALIRELSDGGAYVEYEMDVSLGIEGVVPLRFAQTHGWQFTESQRVGMVTVKPVLDLIVSFGVTFESEDFCATESKGSKDCDEESTFQIEFIAYRMNDSVSSRFDN
ncbi:PIN domain-containing protein [Ruania rhizosphaerae]|uniref:PIN domain-containing protein n=1 Tax=Ruania rhizosphaerae TaxID=1840413 RepID=UPI001359736F|nr:PIN domain-containing protein [Ruania rhizosphaerae]